MKIRSDDIILITGKRGSGKSYFLKKWFLVSLAIQHKRVVIWDTNHEYQPIRSGLITYNLRSIIEEFNKKTQEIIYRPQIKTPEKFNQFCKIVFRLNNIFLMIEEIEQFASAYKVPPGFKTIIDIGRHRGLGVICTSRRTLMLPSDLPFNMDHLIIFRQTRPQDLDYLAKWVGEEVYQLKEMPEYAYLHYDARMGILTPHAKI